MTQHFILYLQNGEVKLNWILSKNCRLFVPQTTIVEYAPRLMPRQIDEDGNDILQGKIEALGLNVLTNARMSAVAFDESGAVKGIQFGEDPELQVDAVIVSAGITPRDELARACGLELGPRGGVKVTAECVSVSDPSVFAVGEVALHDHSVYGTMVYGLVAPGYSMADAVAAGLCGRSKEESVFAEADMSTKLKLMGVDVASFGNTAPPAGESVSIMRKDPFEGVYKKLFFRFETIDDSLNESQTIQKFVRAMLNILCCMPQS